MNEEHRRIIRRLEGERASLDANEDRFRAMGLTNEQVERGMYRMRVEEAADAGIIHEDASGSLADAEADHHDRRA